MDFLSIQKDLEPFFFQNLIPVFLHVDVSKNRGKIPKMDGENNGKPYVQKDDMGVPLFLETPMLILGVLCRYILGWSVGRGNI